jgi:hypothetical protein
MSVLKAIVKNGKIEMEAPVDWPEGTEVRIEPIPASSSNENGDEDTPELIARDLALMDQIEPLEMTDEEQAEWNAARESQRDWEKARFDDHAEALRKIWE